jgi:hypothetical protein
VKKVRKSNGLEGECLTLGMSRQIDVFTSGKQNIALLLFKVRSP